MLNQILNNMFADGHEKIRAVLDKHALMAVIERLYGRFEFLYKKPGIHLPKIDIKAVSATFIMGINSKMVLIEDPAEKAAMERLVADISIRILSDYVRIADQPMKVILQMVGAGIEEACSMGGYDAKAILGIIKVHMTDPRLQQAPIQTPINTTVVKCWWAWQGKKEELEELIRDLVSRNVFASIKELRRLFARHSGDITVRARKDDLDFIMILIDELYNQGFIKMVGNRGHFHPLNLYGVDLAGEVLIEKEPGRLKFTIRKNKARYATALQKVQKWIRHLTLLS